MKKRKVIEKVKKWFVFHKNAVKNFLYMVKLNKFVSEKYTREK